MASLILKQRYITNVIHGVAFWPMLHKRSYPNKKPYPWPNKSVRYYYPAYEKPRDSFTANYGSYPRPYSWAGNWFLSRGVK